MRRNGLEPEAELRTPTAPRVKAEPKVYVERDERGTVTVVTPAGLALIERLARQGAPQTKLAASLGLLLKVFKSLLGARQGENDVRLAYERGKGDFDHEVVKGLIRAGKTAWVPLIFLGKSVCGMQEAGAAAAQVQNNVSLMLPRPRTRAELFSILGVPDPKEIAGTGADAMKVVESSPQPALPAPGEPQSESETSPPEE